MSRVRLLNTNSDLVVDLDTGEVRVGNPQDKWAELAPIPTPTPRQSVMVMGDSLAAACSPYDVTNEVDAHIGGPGGHAPCDYLTLGNVLAGSPLDVLGSVATVGYTVQQIKDIHLPTVLAAKPRYCICCSLGGNDILASGAMPASTLCTAESILDTLRLAGITPVVCTMLPLANSTNTNATQTEVHRYNAWVTRYAQKYGLPLLDFYGALVDTNSGNGTYGTYKSTYGQTDDTHPSGIGTGLALAPLVRDWIKQVTNTAQGGVRHSPALWQSGTGSIVTGQLANPLMIRTGGSANTPDGWATFQVDLALAAPTGVVYPGNEWTLTSQSSSPNIAQGPTLAISPGDEWDLSFRLGTTVTTSQTWVIWLFDQTSTARFIFGNATTDNNMVMTSIPQGTFCHFRGKVPAGSGVTSLMPQLNLVGGAGAVMKIGQFTFRNLTAMSI